MDSVGMVVGGIVALSTLLAVGLALTAFWLWMLVDCALREPGTGRRKVVWLIAIALTQVLGAAAYFLFRRPRRRAEAGA